MEKHLGRFLKKNECIHHIDGDKANNKIDNLLLCKNVAEHTKIHIEMEKFMFQLIKKGVVYYDKTEREFKIRES